LAWLEASRDPPTRLPAALLYEHLHSYTSLRVPARYGVYVFLFVSVLSGVGFARLLAPGARALRFGLAGLLVAVMTIEVLPWRPEFVLVDGRPVDYWLAAQPGEGAIVQLPLTDAGSERQAYFTLIHGKPSVSGHDNLRTPLHRRLLDTLGEIPDREGIELLRSIGVRYLIVDTGWYEDIDALDDLDEALVGLGVDEAACFEGYRVYRLEP
jgi:hypothetical protein